MTVNLIRLPYDIVSGAQVSYDSDVADNPSESGISGVLAMRAVRRIYMLAPGPSRSSEMQAIIMATRGGRYPFAIRDYADNYQLNDEVIPHTGTVATIGRTWAPATGDLSFFERILAVDTQERPFVVKKNDVTLTITTDYTFADFGKINIPGLVTDDVVKVTGDYLMVVRAIEAASTTIITNSTNKFSDMRLKQIFENELNKLFPS